MWSHSVMIDLCARLRLACRALSPDGAPPIVPADIRMDDLPDSVRREILNEASQDVWDIIAEMRTPTPPEMRTREAS